jgi:RimJ/RimL family protein N-acetyltransferase
LLSAIADGIMLAAVEREISVPRRIEGAVVDLRPLERRDVAAYVGAFADDPDLGPAAGSERDPDEASLLERLERAPEAAQRGRHVELAIVERDDDRLLGTVVLHSFDWRHERVEVGLWLARDARGRGLATAAVASVLNWAFEELGMHRVEMITLPALRHVDHVLGLAERLGFRREGLMRERNFERGRRLDTLMLSVLRHEWEDGARRVSGSGEPGLG